jgi:hypothetical protein
MNVAPGDVAHGDGAPGDAGQQSAALLLAL